MHFLRLAKGLPKFFSTKTVQNELGIQADSARVLCARYAKKGIFLRLKRDLYCFKEAFLHFSREDILELSGLIQENTYLSFTTALAYYGVLPGVAHHIEAVSFQRSTEKQVGHLTWKYHHLPKNLFFSTQTLAKGAMTFTIATPEKALLDLLYLHSLGRYSVDLRRINLEPLSLEKLFELAKQFPPRTQRFLLLLTRRSFDPKGKKGLSETF
ncbi:MAG: hypothetical protein WC777_01950 [Candidatus Gracilibacteria bacterium]